MPDIRVLRIAIEGRKREIWQNFANGGKQTECI